MPDSYNIAKNLVDRNFRNIDDSLIMGVDNINESYMRFTVTFTDGRKITVEAD